jgi:hypothetical protein
MLNRNFKHSEETQGFGNATSPGNDDGLMILHGFI